MTFAPLGLDLTSIDARFDRLEAIMADAAAEITILTGKFDALNAIVTDVRADFAALLAALSAERENLTPAGQAALDLANERAAAAAEVLSALDAEVGEHDGENPPA